MGLIVSENLDLWDRVSKTDPKHTKGANVRGNKITAISPQSQIMGATKEFGGYGIKWGFKAIEMDYTLEGKGLAVFKGVFFYPGGEFPIISSIGLYRDNAQTKIDDDFAKKVETDALTKALSKLGFNADVFMGLYDDNRYVSQMREEFAEGGSAPESAPDAAVNADELKDILNALDAAGCAPEEFCKSWGIATVNELWATNYGAAKAWIKTYLENQQ